MAETAEARATMARVNCILIEVLVEVVVGSGVESCFVVDCCEEDVDADGEKRDLEERCSYLYVLVSP